MQITRTGQRRARASSAAPYRSRVRPFATGSAVLRTDARVTYGQHAASRMASRSLPASNGVRPWIRSRRAGQQEDQRGLTVRV